MVWGKKDIFLSSFPPLNAAHWIWPQSWLWLFCLRPSQQKIFVIIFFFTPEGCSLLFRAWRHPQGGHSQEGLLVVRTYDYDWFTNFIQLHLLPVTVLKTLGPELDLVSSCFTPLKSMPPPVSWWGSLSLQVQESGIYPTPNPSGSKKCSFFLTLERTKGFVCFLFVVRWMYLLTSCQGNIFSNSKWDFEKVWGCGASDQLNQLNSERTRNCGCSRQCTALGEIFAEQLLQLKWARSSSQGLSTGDTRYVQLLVVCPPTTHLCVHSTSVWGGLCL